MNYETCQAGHLETIPARRTSNAGEFASSESIKQNYPGESFQLRAAVPSEAIGAIHLELLLSISLANFCI